MSPATSGDWDPFDVEAVRTESRRLIIERRAERPTLVLGSTQRPDIVDTEAARSFGVDIRRRRSGGGAVLLWPGDHLWFDVWVPRDDPLFVDDVIDAPTWVGEWWAAALAATSDAPLAVQRGSCAGSAVSKLVCFAGVGPGEVLVGARKVVGVAQWRARQGALFHVAAYWRWDPDPLPRLLALEPDASTALAAVLAEVAVGIDALAPTPPEHPSVVTHLLEQLPPGEWEVRRRDAPGGDPGSAVR